MPRWFSVPSGLVALLALALCFVPLFDLLGYEFAFAIGLLTAATSVVVGLGLGRSRADGPASIVRAAALAPLHLVPALAIISVNALFVRNCAWGEGLVFFLALPVGSAAYGGAGGAFLAQLLRRQSRRARGLAAAAFIAAPLLASLWALYREPPIVAYDHLWGHFAGSLYDEVIELDARLVGLRAVTLVRIGALALLASVLVQARRRGLGLLVAATLAVVVPVALLEGALGPRFGFAVEREDVLRELSVTEVRPGLVIHLPPSVPLARRRAIADDHAFRLEQLLRLFEVELDEPVHSFVYEDSAQKNRLQGARGTMIAKPWLYEIHVHDPVAPHPVVAHELAHVVAAAFGGGPLRVSSRFGLFVNMGLVEGLAEGVTPPRGELDIDAFSHALMQLDLAPDLSELLGPVGFWTAAPRRAYTLAGSFVRHLLSTRGAARLKAAYAHGDFEAAYGEPLAALVAGWEAHVRAQPLSSSELELAREQFRTPSIFERTCAHEVAALRQAARAARPEQAVSLHQQICEFTDDHPAARLELALAHLRADDVASFTRLADPLLAGEGLTAVQRAQLLETQGDLAWQRGERELARARFAEVQGQRLGPGSERMQWARVWALDEPPEVSELLRRFLRDELPAVAAVIELDDAFERDPSDKTYPYLIARQLHRVEACAPAVRYLELAAGHPSPLFEAERLRLLSDCQARLGEVDEARRSISAYAAAAPTSGERARALDELARLAWREARRLTAQ